jgi:hypothetical protein
MTSFIKKFLLVFLLSFEPVLTAQSPSAPAHISAHINRCNERDSDGLRIQTCYLAVVLVDGRDKAILHDGFNEFFYPSRNGKIFVTLKPGRYHVSLYAAWTPQKPRWEKVVIVKPGVTVNLGKL